MIIDEMDANRFSGYFDWIGTGNASGREYFRGTYDLQTRRLSIQGYRLDNPRGNIGLGSYQAILNMNGNDFTSGRWSGGGVWEATRQN